MPVLTRRHFLASAGLAAGAGIWPLRAQAPASSEHAARRVLRIAHLTDTHVLPSLDSDQGLAEAIRHAQAAKPDFIFFGGDLIMDALKKEKDEVLAQWAVWQRVLSAELKSDAVFALGNHDAWGWALRGESARNATSDDGYGMRLALGQLGLKDRYHSFDRGGWHFVVLDSTHHDPASGRGYTARIDETQFAWLVADLARVPASTPVCVLSHIPILAACTFLDGENEREGEWLVPGAWMHIDARVLKDLFRQHPNVKLCLSGHVHLVDDVRYLGVRYCCNGAVSGGWWKGPYQEFGPAYALVDLYADGTADNQLVYYRG